MKDTKRITLVIGCAAMLALVGCSKSGKFGWAGDMPASYYTGPPTSYTIKQGYVSPIGGGTTYFVVPNR